MLYINQTKCFQRNIKFWKFLGIWPSQSSSSYYDYYMKTFIIIVCVLYNVLLTINFYFLPRKLDSFIEEMVFYFTELSVLSKIITFLTMHHEIENILAILQNDMFQPNNDEEFSIIENACKFNTRYYNVVATVSVVSHLTLISYPLIVHVFLSSPLALPVSSYSFLSENVKERFAYPLYLYQGIGMHFHMWYNVNIDNFFLGLMIFTIAQLDILDRKLRRLTNNIESSKEKKIMVVADKREEVNDALFIYKFNQAVNHFNEVTRYCKKIQKVFSVTLFVQFSMASCIICVCLFRFILPAPFAYYIFLATYMFIMIIQILVPCWFGTRIINKSALLANSIYDCDWITKSSGFKTNMRLFVEITSVPIQIMGWKMFPLSLTTFTSIMNTAYSFFALLRHMQSR